MKPLPHRYEGRLEGRADGYVTLRAAGLPELRAAPPADFDGPGDAWSPEQLLVAAVEACFLFTLRVVAAASKVPFTALDVTAEGTVDRKDGVTRFTEIVLRPRLTVPAGTDRARAIRAMEKAEKACLISASLAVAVRLEPEVVEAA
jgi:peroxiredoxin-like protein